MKVDKSNGVNFGASVDAKFIRSVDKYYMNRNLPIQYTAFHKFLDKFEYFGDKNSEIVYGAVRKDNGFIHSLYLKNTKINKKSGLILCQKNTFRDILNYFQGMTDDFLLQCEKLLVGK